MLLDYFTPLQDMPTHCAQFKEWTLKNCFTTKNQYGNLQISDTSMSEAWMYYGHYCYDPKYQQNLETIKRCIEICHVFSVADLPPYSPVS